MRSVGGADEAVIVEGVAKKLADQKKFAKFAKIYFEKYEWDITKMDGPVFVIQPEIVFGQIEQTFTKTATRWRFEKS